MEPWIQPGSPRQSPGHIVFRDNDHTINSAYWINDSLEDAEDDLYCDEEYLYFNGIPPEEDCF